VGEDVLAINGTAFRYFLCPVRGFGCGKQRDDRENRRGQPEDQRARRALALWPFLRQCFTPARRATRRRAAATYGGARRRASVRRPPNVRRPSGNDR
jgi:hypothetical protein